MPHFLCPLEWNNIGMYLLRTKCNIFCYDHSSYEIWSGQLKNNTIIYKHIITLILATLPELSSY